MRSAVHRRRPCRVTVAMLCAATGCVPGDKVTANTGAGLTAELVFCRYSPTNGNTAEIALRTAQNLGTAVLPQHAGRELQVRTHPDGDRIVFARQSTPGNTATAELFVAAIAGTSPELRLTINNVADDHPCWSPTGDRVLFVSERGGERRLHVAAADGSNAHEFLAAGIGTADDDPDWSRATDRIVFSRRDAGGVRRLQLVNGDGTGLVPLTVGSPAATAELGQREPTFAPDGQSVAFVEVTAPGVSRLFTVEVATGIVQPLFDPQGEVRLPRFSPGGERLFCGVAQPAAGRQGLRLGVVAADGSNPLLVEPGEQWLLGGIDVLPAIAVPPGAAAPEVVGLDGLEVAVTSGTPVQGGIGQLESADGQQVAIATATFGDHEIASIQCRFSLPVANAADVLALRATIVASVTRSDAATTLRTTLFHPVLRRHDTIAELPAPGTGARTLTFATQSLAHVSLEREVRVSVIGEIGAGARAELHIDQVRLEFVRVAGPSSAR